MAAYLRARGWFRRVRIAPDDDVDARVTVRVGGATAVRRTAQVVDVAGHLVSVVLDAPPDAAFEVSFDTHVRESAEYREWLRMREEAR